MLIIKKKNLEEKREENIPMREREEKELGREEK